MERISGIPSVLKKGSKTLTRFECSEGINNSN